MDALYWVLGASALVWGGLFAYLIGTDLRLRRLEAELDREKRA